MISARRRGAARKGGLDGVELSFASLHLVPAFWSPGTNRRTDQYGGSLDNRLRFSDEILEEVRGQVGGDYIVSVRMIADELIEDGLSDKECLEIAVRLAKSGKVDLLNVWAGVPVDWRSLAVHMANMAFPVAPFLHLASAIKAHVDIPIIHAQRVTDIATAARAVAEGHVDLIGMTRAHLADPHIVRKLMEGRPDDIRQVRRRQLLHRPHLCRWRGALYPESGHRPRAHHAAYHREGRQEEARRRGRRRPAGLEAARRLGRARPRRRAVRAQRAHGWTGEHRRARDLARVAVRHRALARSCRRRS
jgi:tRNA-dihydrouridine synthase